MVKELSVDPMGRVLEASRVQEKHHLFFLIVACNESEVSTAGLTQHGSIQVADEVELFDL